MTIPSFLLSATRIVVRILNVLGELLCFFRDEVKPCSICANSQNKIVPNRKKLDIGCKILL